MTTFVGVDWAEAHHDVCVKNELGRSSDVGSPMASRECGGSTSSWNR